MNWYNGSIAEAVSFSKREGAVFFVAIFGEDEASKNLEASVNDSEITPELTSSRYVCIRLTADSQEHTQFKQIYTGANAPCLYFISLAGAPVEVVHGESTVSDLRTKCDSAWKKHSAVVQSQKPHQTQSKVAPETDAQPSSLAQPPQAAAGSRENSARPEAVSGDLENESDTANVTLEEKIERARQLAAARQKLKLEEEAEEARQREKERREAGKGMAELKRWQDEQEAKRLVEERKREKREEQELRQRLREQIAQDRAERNKRTNASIVYDGAEPGPSAPLPKPTIITNPPINYAGKARLQFRMPDGSSQTHSFEQDVTLGHVRRFLCDEGHVKFTNFSLFVAFPRREFTTADYEKSLKDLGLLPSATLLVIPAGGRGLGGVAGGSGMGIFTFFTAFFSYLLYPVTLLFGYIQRALPSSGSSSGTSPSQSQGSSGLARGENRLGGSGAGASYRSQNIDKTNPNANPSGDSTSEDNIRKRNVKPSSSSEGNIHRLRNQESDSDDELGTWNGNSTQQKPR